jgi:hypothetical protein
MIKVLEGLYLGNREDARDRRRLEEAGITHVVNCTEELPNYHEGAFEYLALKMLDPDPTFHTRIERCCAFIDEARRDGKSVLVHCFAAISRSPAVVLTYLCHQGEPLDRAAIRLAEVVWTNPDLLFLRQLVDHLGVEYSDAYLERLACVLQGRPRTEEAR